MGWRQQSAVSELLSNADEMDEMLVMRGTRLNERRDCDVLSCHLIHTYNAKILLLG